MALIKRSRLWEKQRVKRLLWHLQRGAITQNMKFFAQNQNSHIVLEFYINEFIRRIKTCCVYPYLRRLQFKFSFN